MQLELLQHVVDGEPRVRVVQADDEAERHLRRLALAVHAVDPRAAELLVAGLRAQRPPERVDDLLERPLDLPHLLHAERPHLRILRRQPEALQRRAGQVPPAALGEHGRPRDHVGAGLEVRLLAARLVAALVARAHADHGAVLDQQLVPGRLRQQVRAGGLGALAEPAVELRHGHDDVAVVAEGRRRRLQRDRPLAVEHEVDRLGADLAVVRPGAVVGQQLVDRAGVHHRARELMGAGDAALLDHRHRHLAERLGQLGIVLEQLQEPDRAGQAGLSPADDRHADLDPLVLRVRRRAEELRRRVHRRRELDRRDRASLAVRHPLSRPSAPSRPP